MTGEHSLFGQAVNVKAGLQTAIAGGNAFSFALESPIAACFTGLSEQFLHAQDFYGFMQVEGGQLHIYVAPEIQSVAEQAFRAWRTHPNPRVSGNYRWGAYLAFYTLFQAGNKEQGQKMHGGLHRAFLQTYAKEVDGLGLSAEEIEKLTAIVETIEQKGSAISPYDYDEITLLLTALWNLVPDVIRKSKIDLKPQNVFANLSDGP